MSGSMTAAEQRPREQLSSSMSADNGLLLWHDGRDYVLAVLTQGGPTEQAGIDAIEHISAQVYERL